MSEEKKNEVESTVKLVKDMTQPEINELLKIACKAIEGAFFTQGAEFPLFALLVFNDPAIVQYASNFNPESVVVALRDIADRLEKKQVLINYMGSF